MYCIYVDILFMYIHIEVCKYIYIYENICKGISREEAISAWSRGAELPLKRSQSEPSWNPSSSDAQFPGCPAMKGV